MMTPSFLAASLTRTTDQSNCDRSTFSSSCLYFTHRFLNLNHLPLIPISNWYWLKNLDATMFLSFLCVFASSSRIARWWSYSSRNSSAVQSSSNYITKISMSLCLLLQDWQEEEHRQKDDEDVKWYEKCWFYIKRWQNVQETVTNY